MADRKYEKHPSWAMIQLSRTHGSFNLFGSQVQHQHAIALRITPAERAHDYGHDIFHATAQPYIEVYMTAAQFAEAITSLNQGMGTPCTLSYLKGEVIPRAPKEASEADRAELHVRTKAKEASESIDEGLARIEEIFAKPTVGKNDRAEILKLVASMGSRFKNDLPFYIDQYAEMTEKVKARAVVEFEAMINSKLQALGVTATQVGLALPEARNDDQE